MELRPAARRALATVMWSTVLTVASSGVVAAETAAVDPSSASLASLARLNFTQIVPVLGGSDDPRRAGSKRYHLHRDFIVPRGITRTPGEVMSLSTIDLSVANVAMFAATCQASL